MQDMIMVTENWKGTETNMLLNFTDYMKDIVFQTNKEKMEIALEVLELEHTRDLREEWVETYLAANKSYSARYCSDYNQLLQFLKGKLNDDIEEVRFDCERCSKDCLKKLQELGISIYGRIVQEAEIAKEVRDYEVEVKEVLSRIETVNADSLEDAIDKVMDKYHAQEIVLDAEDFVGVDFLPSEEEKNKTMKHLRSR